MTAVSLTFSDLSNTKLAPLDRAKQLAATLLSERSEASGALVARQLHEVEQLPGPRLNLSLPPAH